ncbi:hypothetical protein L3X38_037159 [Prunus dulcis]|uniref:Ty3 transposon capsid-like protein domain-containing protein n=1 Tax=Prunus dulcis TaxID=3755 RepID=A0AAD4YP97_PRUDU|nr:hypothetical protein L3X38_037159 [Prunus dulcis]
MKSLRTGKLSCPSTSYEPDQKLNKKVVRDSEDEDDTQAYPMKKEAESGDNKNSIDTLKIDFKIDIPIYKGDIDLEKLDNRINTLETYFIVYKYSNVQKIKFASLKLSSHALTWWKSYQRQYDVSKLTWKNFKKPLKNNFIQLSMKMKDGISGNTSNKDLDTIEAKNKRIDKKDDRSKPVNKTDWQKKGKQRKEGQRQEVYCDHCQASRDAKDKCWILHHELRPKRQKNNQGRNDKKATLTAQQAEELPELKQPDVTLTLMTRPANTEDMYNHEELFHVNIQVKQSVVQVIIELGSQKNLISEALLRKVGLATRPHPKPYLLGWIQKHIDLQIAKQCTFNFAITN